MYKITHDVLGLVTTAETLYTASKLALRHNGNVILDGRLVAYAYNGTIRPGFQAYMHERTEIETEFDSVINPR